MEDKYSLPRYGRILNVLNCDEKLANTTPPIKAKFITEGVKLEVVQDEKFTPVNSATFNLKNQEWLDWGRSITNKVIDIYQDAEGGTLVLNTSYLMIELIKHHLSETEIDCSNFIFASKDLTLSEQKERFLEITKNGQKPLWFAIGGAWTGLDVFRVRIWG